MSFQDINDLGKNKIPFLFISDFKAQNIKVFPLDKLKELDIEFNIDENYIKKPHNHTLSKEAIPFEKYKQKFNAIIDEIKQGNTYLLNLTQPTKIQTPLSLSEFYSHANAKYKLRYQNKFVCFSPEQFIKIENNTIHTFPMKGTIDASLPNAKESILANEKEMAEHIMVVDLLRNDLSMVASNVRVKDFRYITHIDAGDKKLLQVSSHISGEVGSDWEEKLGDILNTLLPAGSISGTPKRSTIEIIENIEDYEREYFSGVFGVYDGQTFDSGVMIRFIQKDDDNYTYKSGGGITLDSNPLDEYNELLEKVYLP